MTHIKLQNDFNFFLTESKIKGQLQMSPRLFLNLESQLAGRFPVLGKSCQEDKGGLLAPFSQQRWRAVFKRLDVNSLFKGSSPAEVKLVSVSYTTCRWPLPPIRKQAKRRNPVTFTSNPLGAVTAYGSQSSLEAKPRKFFHLSGSREGDS